MSKDTTSKMINVRKDLESFYEAAKKILSEAERGSDAPGSPRLSANLGPSSSMQINKSLTGNVKIRDPNDPDGRIVIIYTEHGKEVDRTKSHLWDEVEEIMEFILDRVLSSKERGILMSAERNIMFRKASLVGINTQEDIGEN